MDKENTDTKGLFIVIQTMLAVILIVIGIFWSIGYSTTGWPFFYKYLGYATLFVLWYGFNYSAKLFHNLRND